jgi:electron-transferring-flavoprotein dehydrogenase
MTITGGAFPPAGPDHEGDDEAIREIVSATTLAPEVSGGLSKVDAVFASGNKTRDDIPSHLTVGKDVPPEVADFYHHLCPAGVYERQGDKLVVNAPNCVDCKATDVLGPRWMPREGGSGPKYKQM